MAVKMNELRHETSVVYPLQVDAAAARNGSAPQPPLRRVAGDWLGTRSDGCGGLVLRRDSRGGGDL